MLIGPLQCASSHLFPTSSRKVLMAMFSQKKNLPSSTHFPHALCVSYSCSWTIIPGRGKGSHCYHLSSIHYVVLWYVSNTFSQQCRKNYILAHLLVVQRDRAWPKTTYVFLSADLSQQKWYKVITWVLIRILGTDVWGVGETSLYISGVQVNLVNSSELSLNANISGAEKDKGQGHDGILLPPIYISPTGQD